MRRLLALLALSLLLAGCGKRERLNPFDPSNPVTGGRPAGFAALAGASSVQLQWDSPATPDLLGFQVFRRVEGESTFRAITAVLPARGAVINDFGLQNGLDHHYQLYFVFVGGFGSHPAEETATPGAVRPWITDNASHALARLSPDARHVAFQDAGFRGPVGIAVDVSGGRVWVTDTDAGEVAVYNPSTTDRFTISWGNAIPGAIAIDPVDESAWVCDAGNNEVLHFLPTGAGAVPPQLAALNDPIDIALDPIDQSVWVCERGASQVRHYDASGATYGATAVSLPSRVAVDSVTHDAWVTSFTRGQVVRLSPTPALGSTVAGFRGPIGIAVDSRRGRIWVADAAANQVVALRRDGSVEFRISGLSEVREIAVDLASGEAWATIQGAGTVARLSPLGFIIRQVGGLGRPDGIALGDITP